MGNLLYDFNCWARTIVPYIGAGAGVGVRQTPRRWAPRTSSTVFCLPGPSWVSATNIDPMWRVKPRCPLLYGTSETRALVRFTYQNNNISRDVEACSTSSVPRRLPVAAPAPGRSGLLRRSSCSSIGTVRTSRLRRSTRSSRLLVRYKDQGLCPRDGDRPYRQVGPGQLQTWRLSLRRANTVKDCPGGAKGVPANGDLGHIGKGEDPAAWFRRPMASASRRTAASRIVIQ